MANGIKTVLFHVADPARAAATYSALLGTEPYHADDSYVGFQVDGQEIGLVSAKVAGGKTGAVPHVHVEDIEAAHRALLDAGAEELSPVADVGGGLRVSTVRDVDGNVIGLSQPAS